MATDCPRSAGTDATPRATPRPCVPGDSERYLLYLAQWVRLADASPRRAPLGERVSFRSALATGWNLGAYPCCPPHGRARCRRASGRTERCDSGPPVGHNDGKRGPRGADAGNNVYGRTRHLLVGPVGVVVTVVHAADIQDRDRARLVVGNLHRKQSRLRMMGADGGDAGQVVEWAQRVGGWPLASSKRPDGVSRFHVLPRR